MWHCIECEKMILPDENGLPASKYWAERDESVLKMSHLRDYVVVFCSAECSLTYHEKRTKTP